MSKSVTGSLLRSKNQELVVTNFLRIHGKITHIPQDIIDLIVLFFVRFDFIFSQKMYTTYLRRESKTCWINNYCVLKCWVEKKSGCCLFSIETAKLSQLIKDISMQLNLYCNEVSQSWTKRFQLKRHKLCITQTLFKHENTHQIKTLHVIWNTKLLSIAYKANSMIYQKPLTNTYILNIDSKEKLEWLITAPNAKHILLNNHKSKLSKNTFIQQIYWYQKTFYFQISYQQNAAIKFIINLFDEKKTFHFKIDNKRKTKIAIKFDKFESVYYKLKISRKSKPDITTTNDETIKITFNSKPFGFSLHEDVDGLNAICRRVKTTQLQDKHLKKGLYIHSINDIIVDNKPFDEIKSLLSKSLPPTTIIFSPRPLSNISISSRYIALQLVSGYIHEIEDNLFESNIIIPQIINQICFQFYFTSMLIYCLISRSESMDHHHLHIADINDEMKKTLKSFECTIFCLNEPECIETGIDNPSPSSFGLCRANNLKLPQNVNNQLLNNYNNLTSFHSFDYYKDSPNVVLFKIGGQYHDEAMDECYAIILTDSQFIIKKEEEQTNSVKEIDAFSWRLPSLPVPMRDVCTCFSDRKQSLICIGGGRMKTIYSNKVYSLSFSDIKNKNWSNEENMIKWEHMTDMIEKRRNAACCFIENGDNKLLVVGGRRNNHAVNSGEIYDYTTKEWTQIAKVPCKTFGAGICYDRCSNKVYLGGGYCRFTELLQGTIRNRVVWYDINKNVWNTNLQPYTSNHTNGPVLWINNNILSIMSAKSRTIEYLDLRVNACWNKMSKNDLLTDTLGVECDSNQCRLYI